MTIRSLYVQIQHNTLHINFKLTIPLCTYNYVSNFISFRHNSLLFF